MAENRELPTVPACKFSAQQYPLQIDSTFEQDFVKMQASSPIPGVDVNHQLWRLRHSRVMLDGEVEAIMRMLVENVQTYDQVTEVSTFLCRLDSLHSLNVILAAVIAPSTASSRSAAIKLWTVPPTGGDQRAHRRAIQRAAFLPG